MLNKAISRDRVVADLVAEVGPAGGLVYTWLIAHLDREGRVEGDPVVVKGMAVPRLPCCTVEVIEQTLGAAARLGLVDWYESNGDRYVAYPKFHKNQKGLRIKREPESELPAPPGRQRAAKLPPEGKGREGKESSSPAKPEKPTAASAPVTSPEDFESACRAAGLAGSLTAKARARLLLLLSAGAVQPHEIAEARRIVGAKQPPPTNALSFAVGVIARDRETAAAQPPRAHAPTPPPVPDGGSARVPSMAESKRRLEELADEPMSPESRQAVEEAMARIGGPP